MLFQNLRGNVLGGITAGIVALPLALAFGVQSGLGPSAGLYGAIFIGFFASLFGGTPTQISGPTAPMTAVSMVIIAGIMASHEGNIERALPFILAVFLLAGLLQIILGLSGVGKYIRYIPNPVVSGFMTAIGVIILLTQILPVLGYYTANDQAYISSFKPHAEEVLLDKILKDEAGEGILVLENFKETVKRAQALTKAEIHDEALTLAKKESSVVLGALTVLPRALEGFNPIEAILALLTIGIIYGFRYVTKKIPSTLVALVVVSCGAYFLGLDYYPIQSIPTGIPAIQWSIFSEVGFSDLSPYFFTALTLAFLGAIDSLLTSVVADNMTRTKHDPNKELIGQGIGNSVAALFGGLPGAGATIRTVVNINAGGTQKLSGMAASLLLLSVLLLAGPVASLIPAAVLAGILVTVGIGVMDYRGLRAIPKMPKNEVVVMLVVLVLSVFWNLVYAVGIGFVLATLIFMKKIGDLNTSMSQVLPLDPSQISESSDLTNQERVPNLKHNIFIKELKGPLFFGFTSAFQLLAKKIPSNAEIIIVKMQEVPYMDQSGLYAFEEVLHELARREVRVFIVGLQKQPSLMMHTIDLIPGVITQADVFVNYQEALEAIKRLD